MEIYPNVTCKGSETNQLFKKPNIRDLNPKKVLSIYLGIGLKPGVVFEIHLYFDYCYSKNNAELNIKGTLGTDRVECLYNNNNLDI